MAGGKTDENFKILLPILVINYHHENYYVTDILSVFKSFRNSCATVGSCHYLTGTAIGTGVSSVFLMSFRS